MLRSKAHDHTPLSPPSFAVATVEHSSGDVVSFHCDRQTQAGAVLSEAAVPVLSWRDMTVHSVKLSAPRQVE